MQMLLSDRLDGLQGEPSSLYRYSSTWVGMFKYGNDNPSNKGMRETNCLVWPCNISLVMSNTIQLDIM